MKIVSCFCCFHSDQSRKVLEEIQMQKKLLKQGAATTLNPTTPPATVTNTVPVILIFASFFLQINFISRL